MTLNKINARTQEGSARFTPFLDSIRCRRWRVVCAASIFAIMFVLSRFAVQLRHFLGDICWRQRTGFHSFHDVFNVVTGYHIPRPSTCRHVTKKRLNTVTFIMFPAISETLGCTAVVCCKHESKKKFVGTTCHTKGVVSITTVGVDLQFKHRCEKTQLCHTGDAIVICVTVSTTCGRTSHWLCTSASVHRCDRP